jgi:photosynthetic reaction center H subunit
MGTGAITPYVDVAQLVLYLFWIFFAGVIYYLVRENHREGYPMETEDGRGDITGWPVPRPKTYKLPHGGEVTVPSGWRETRQLRAEPTHRWNGSPLEPTGDPMRAEVGPGAYAERADVPDLTADGDVKIVPLRAAPDYKVSPKDVDPRGLPVIGADGEVGGIVRDMWVDRSEMIFRYIEVETGSGADARRVLLPTPFARVKRDAVRVQSVMGRHFAMVPTTRQAEQVTFLEEEKITAFYGAGRLYADERRAEPLV